MKKMQPVFNNPQDTSNVLDQSLKVLVEGITGIASSSRQDLILSIGHIFQRMRSVNSLQNLKIEWDYFKQKGEIKDDYIESEQHQTCLQEMLDFLDKDSPDEIRFSFLKKIFLITATEKLSSRDEILPQQYMRICRGLSSGEVLVLLATFQRSKQGSINPNDTSVRTWLIEIAGQSSLRYPELVETHEKTLVGKNLLSQRIHSDQSGVVLGQHYRLTDLGYDICKFI